MSRERLGGISNVVRQTRAGKGLAGRHGIFCVSPHTPAYEQTVATQSLFRRLPTQARAAKVDDLPDICSVSSRDERHVT